MRSNNPLLQALMTIETMQEQAPSQPRMIFMVVPGSSPSDNEEVKEAEDPPPPPHKRPHAGEPAEAPKKKPSKSTGGRTRGKKTQHSQGL